MSKTYKTAPPETCAGQQPHLVLVANEKGGVRKTSTVLAAAELLGGAGAPAEIIQIDDQARLQRLYPNATRINLPKALEIRSGDMAETKALDPLFEAFRPRTDTALIDIGANYDTRVADFLLGMDVEQEIKRHGLMVKVIVPVTSDPEAIRLGARTAKRMAIAMPSATIHPLFALDGGDFDNPTDDGAARAMKEVLQPLAQANGAIRMPKLYPTLLGFLEGKSIMMSELIPTDNDAFAASHSISRAFARSFRSELILYLDQLGDEFRRVLRFP